MAMSARERLANERAKEAKFNSGAPGYDKGSYQLPPDYSQLIKQAQAEEAASRGSSAGAKTGGSDPWKGMRSTTGDVSGQSAQSSGRVPTPSSASGSPSGEVPTPTSRPTPEGEGGDETSSMNTVMAIVGAALGAAGARALYKRITRGDPDAIAEAKTIVEEQQGKVSTDPSTAVAPRPDVSTDIEDAEFEDIPPDELTQQKQITNQKMLPAPEMAPEDPALASRMSPIDESIDAQMAPGQDDLQKAMIAKGYTPPGDTPSSVGAGDARGRLIEDPMDVEAIIRNEIERGGRATRMPKFKPKI